MKGVSPLFIRFVLGGVVIAAVLAGVSLADTRSERASAAVQLGPEEQAFMGLLNDYRAQNGLGPIGLDSSIQTAAEWMSTDMGENDYFSHTDSLGRSPWDRMCDSGYCYNTWKGENIAAGYQTAQAVFDAWRDSPGHNANMLGENYLVMGIALVYTQASTFGYYWTNDFGGYVAEPSPPPAPSQTATPTLSPTPSPASPSPTTSPTPTPTGTPAPPPSATPTATPAETPAPIFVRADVNCDADVTAADALSLLRYVGDLPVDTPAGCPPIGTELGGAQPASGAGTVQGDVDCNLLVDGADALSVLLSAGNVETVVRPACEG